MPVAVFRRRGPKLKMGTTQVSLLLLLLLMESQAVSPTAGGDSSDVVTVYGCEGHTVALNCPGAQGLRIVRANYGRFSISVCNPLARGDLDTSCSSEASTSLMLARRCAGRSSCNVLVSPIHLTSPCPGTPAYLEVQYTCDTATREEERLARLPRLGTNITGLWNSHERAITQVAIEEAIKRGAAEGILDMVAPVEEVGGSEVNRSPEEDLETKVDDEKDKVEKAHRINSPTLEGESNQARVDDQAVKSIFLEGEVEAREVEERRELAPKIREEGGWAPSSSLPTTVVSGEVSYRTATIITVSTLVSLCCLLSLAWMCGGRWRRREGEGKAPSCHLSSTSLSDVSSSRPPDSLYHGGHDSQCHCLGGEQHQHPSSTPAPAQSPASLDVGGLYDQLSPARHPPLYSPTPSHCSLPSTAFPPSPRPYSPHYKQPSSPSAVSQCHGNLHLPRSPDPHSHAPSPSSTLALPGTSMAIASTTTHLALPDNPGLGSGGRLIPGGGGGVGGLAIQCSVSYLVSHPRAPSRLQCDV